MAALTILVIVWAILDYPNLRAWVRHRAEVRELHADIEAVTHHG